MFLNVLIIQIKNPMRQVLIRQVPLRRVLFVAIGIFFDEVFKLQATVCSHCHDALMMSTDIKNITVSNTKWCLLLLYYF